MVDEVRLKKLQLFPPTLTEAVEPEGTTKLDPVILKSKKHEGQERA